MTLKHCSTHLLNLLLDETVLLGAIQLLPRQALLQLQTLVLSNPQLILCLPVLSLVTVVSLHCCVQLMKHPQDLLMGLIPNFTTLHGQKHASVYKNS